MSSISSELTAMDATLQHTPYYCEENVYLLCKTLSENGVADETCSDLFAVFISNEKKQRKKESESEPLVWDLDSTLPFPSPLASYVTETIQPSFQLFKEYQRFFRIVHAPLFFEHFASDRRHMKEPDGSWIAQPPPYEPIVAQGKQAIISHYFINNIYSPAQFWVPSEDGILHNLSEYIAMSDADTLSSLDPETVRAAISQKLGIVVSHTQLQDLFTKLP